MRYLQTEGKTTQIFDNRIFFRIRIGLIIELELEVDVLEGSCAYRMITFFSSLRFFGINTVLFTSMI